MRLLQSGGDEGLQGIVIATTLRHTHTPPRRDAVSHCRHALGAATVHKEASAPAHRVFVAILGLAPLPVLESGVTTDAL